MYLLNRIYTRRYNHTLCYLHSTMYLLNRSLIGTSDRIANIFTFHYVSIKSRLGAQGQGAYCDLHSTMYLLNLSVYIVYIHIAIFTFHYVSIKSFWFLTYCKP